MRTYEVEMMVTRFEKVTVQAETYEQAREVAQEKTVVAESENAKVWHTKDITPKPRTVRERISKAFKELRKQGFIARMNYTCCQSCGWAALETAYNATEDSNVVFYHRQDADALTKSGNLDTYRAYDDSNGEYTYKPHRLYLAHQGESHRIAEALEAQGLTIEWDGTQNTRIAVTGVREGSL